MSKIKKDKIEALENDIKLVEYYLESLHDQYAKNQINDETFGRYLTELLGMRGEYEQRLINYLIESGEINKITYEVKDPGYIQ